MIYNVVLISALQQTDSVIHIHTFYFYTLFHYGLSQDIEYESKVLSRHLCTLFTIGKRWKQPRCPSTDKWMNKMWSIYTMEYYSALERKEILIHPTARMNLEDMMLSEIRQPQKDKNKCCMIPFLCGI